MIFYVTLTLITLKFFTLIDIDWIIVAAPILSIYAWRAALMFIYFFGFAVTFFFDKEFASKTLYENIERTISRRHRRQKDALDDLKKTLDRVSA